MFFRIIFAVTAVLCALPLEAGVYKWKDKDGRTHYSDAPPAQVSASEVRTRINSIKGPPVVSQFTPATAPPAGLAKVRMFTTQTCGYCRKAKAFLQARGTPFQELDVGASEAAQSEYQALGGRGVPVILVGDRRMDGYREDQLKGLLEASGL